MPAPRPVRYTPAPQRQRPAPRGPAAPRPRVAASARPPAHPAQPPRSPGSRKPATWTPLGKAAFFGFCFLIIAGCIAISKIPGTPAPGLPGVTSTQAPPWEPPGEQASAHGGATAAVIAGEARGARDVVHGVGHAARLGFRIARISRYGSFHMPGTGGFHGYGLGGFFGF
jgi:hypothetical protein